MTINFLKLARFFVPLSTALVVCGTVLLFVPGPKLSIEFTGGTLMEISVPEGTSKQSLQDAIKSYPGTAIGNFSLAQTKDSHFLVRMRDLSNDDHVALSKHLNDTVGEVVEKQFTTIGPTVGQTLKQRSAMALVIASAGIVLYIAFAFRKIPKSQNPWKFGIVALLTLVHDVMITVGVFVILSHKSTFEVDTLFITALLTIMGYSVNDTIVIFDRIRDNLMTQDRKESFANIAERSLREVLVRSFNTSFSALIMLLALCFLGSESIRWFVIALTLGIGAGTYSSIFIAVPLLVYWRNKKA